MIVFDKAYNYYLQFAKWTEEGINFVCRLKDNAKYEVQAEAIFEKVLEKGEFGVYKIEHIHLKYKENKKEKGLCLRLVWYTDEQGRKYKFITNNWEITDKEVALLYKYRWSIETTFKKMKQNFQLHFFYSNTENGIKNADLEYTDSLFIVDSNSDFVKEQKGIFDDSSLAQDAFDKSFGLDLDSNRRAASIRKTPKKQK
jgi:hypothetical protein